MRFKDFQVFKMVKEEMFENCKKYKNYLTFH